MSVAGLCGDRGDIRSGLNMGVSNLLPGKSLYVLSWASPMNLLICDTKVFLQIDGASFLLSICRNLNAENLIFISLFL